MSKGEGGVGLEGPVGPCWVKAPVEKLRLRVPNSRQFFNSLVRPNEWLLHIQAIPKIE